MDDKPSLKSQILTRSMLICIFTGFSSGLPLYILVSLIPAWLRSENIDLATIGFFTLTGFPYTWKFIWAPLLDRFIPPFLGRRRGWILISQVLLIFSLASFGFFQPDTQTNLHIIAGIATLVAFFSANQDIVLDAYRREILSDSELGLGNSIHVNGYRIASFIPGSLSLILADHYDWSIVFLITAGFMLPGIYMTLFLSTEPNIQPSQQRTLKESIIEPFKEFFTRQGMGMAIGILLFMFLYKLGDGMATALATPFYLDMGFSKTEIGLVVKHASFWPALIAALAAGIIMIKIGINRALWIFGFVQIITILGFAYLAFLGPFEEVHLQEKIILAMVVTAEYIGVGLGTAAFVAFIARTTNPLYTATQFALFTSLTALPRTLFNSLAGVLINHLGYYQYFWLCFFLGIPGMLCLIWIAPWKNKNES